MTRPATGTPSDPTDTRSSEANGWSYAISSGDGLASGDLLNVVTSMSALGIEESSSVFGAPDADASDLTLDGDCGVPTLTAR